MRLAKQQGSVFFLYQGNCAGKKKNRASRNLLWRRQRASYQSFKEVSAPGKLPISTLLTTLSDSRIYPNSRTEKGGIFEVAVHAFSYSPLLKKQPSVLILRIQIFHN